MGYPIAISILVFAAIYMLVRYGYGPSKHWWARLEVTYDNVLRRQLMMDIDPKTALIATAACVGLAAAAGFVLLHSVVVAAMAAFVVGCLPVIVAKHLETKRRQELDNQLVDGLTTLASGARAGLNLVQSMQLLVQNHTGPIKQEFGQILREYELGQDLNRAMRSASDRIGSSLYRLTFTAIEMHRIRGGDSAQSLDRISESIREIHRLEGKLDALTSQGRSQANMMAVMPIVFIILLYLIDPSGIALLFSDAIGRLILLGVLLAIAAAFFWIRKIMAVDI